MMATITAGIQKNDLKSSRPNGGNGLVHHRQVGVVAGHHLHQMHHLQHEQHNNDHEDDDDELDGDEDECGTADMHVDDDAGTGATTAQTTTTSPPLSADAGAQEQEQQQQTNDEPEIDIVINNVVCSFSVSCHLNLREIALNGTNVEYRKENGMITMKIRRPYTTASIWSSGKVTCTGATSEPQAKVAARRFARALQKLGFHVRFNNYRVVNVLGTCCMPFGIKINLFSERHKEAEYEPELHPGVTYKIKSPKATLKIFSTGSVTVTAPSVADVQAAIEHIFPLVYQFRKVRNPEEQQSLKLRKNIADASNDVDAFLQGSHPSGANVNATSARGGGDVVFELTNE